MKSSGFSFAFDGGDCVIWYRRKGTQIFDLVIAPRHVLAAKYDPIQQTLLVGTNVVEFGKTNCVYVCDGREWSIRQYDCLCERDLPHVTELKVRKSIGEIAAQIIARCSKS